MAGPASWLKRARPRRLLVVAVLAAVGIGAAVFAYTETRNGDEAPLDDGQQLVEVRLGDLVNQVTSSGSIVFPNREELTFGVAGTVSAHRERAHGGRGRPGGGRPGAGAPGR